jgi:RNA polymerase sigma-70 factor (ECF subfamily)
MLKQRIFRIVRHREDAEDVLQETLLSAYLHLDNFRGACRFSTWMIKIGINVCFRHGSVTPHSLDCYVQSSAEVGRD